ncbi:hypothetical protein CYMTET_9713 [Cymbomonas tetramitiformis]|uniref:3'(2'),5'-bisphosphate nucleotidase 1 n=1 Tax=Cymbomonas tetramitiformis TaxID=36881 RepID=A0AAE0LEV4_9CHLO|nr:hypothetical protein CYMTET_9713 [Cymbomonas tetramitiformis]
MSEIKCDASAVTVGDFTIQAILYDIVKDHVRAFVGEEGEPNASIQVVINTYREEHAATIGRFKESIGQYAEFLRDASCFVDPIDGTAEYKAGRAQDGSTICVGFADSSGTSIAGLIYKPITSTDRDCIPIYAWGVHLDDINNSIGLSHKPRTLDLAGAKVAWIGNLDGFEDKTIVETKLKAESVLSPDSINELSKQALRDARVPFIKHMDKHGFVHMETLSDNQPTDIQMGGCGNKILHMVMALSATRARNQNFWGYVQMRNLQRWDTCAAEAILKASGGDLFKFYQFVDDAGEAIPYKYTKNRDGVNTDMIELQSYLDYAVDEKERAVVKLDDAGLIKHKAGAHTYHMNEIQNTFRYHLGPEIVNKQIQHDADGTLIRKADTGKLNEHVNVFGLVAIAQKDDDKLRQLQNALRYFFEHGAVESKKIFT